MSRPLFVHCLHFAFLSDVRSQMTASVITISCTDMKHYGMYPIFPPIRRLTNIFNLSVVRCFGMNRRTSDRNSLLSLFLIDIPLFELLIH